MSYRYMRIVVLFDLPMESPKELREYRHFRKYLIKEGFMMLQKSVYVKLALNATAGNVIMDAVRKYAPEIGLIQMMMVTEKQFAKMEYVIGSNTSSVLITTDRLVIL